MKKIFLITSALFAALFCASCSATRPAADAAGELKGPPKALTNQFKMLTVNARHGLTDKNDVKRFAEWIKATGAEVVAVQQIVRATDSKPEFDAFTELLKSLDMRGTFAKARYYQGWDSGNALFCMYPLLQSNSYVLPTGKGRARRSLSFGVFEMGLQPMAFASTDLDVEDAGERLKQVQEILSIQRSLEEFPIIVAGNFGESSKGKPFEKMSERYLSANNPADQTDGMDEQIFLPSSGKVKTIASKKIHDKTLNITGLLVTVEATQ